jgi:hypothetical protein
MQIFLKNLPTDQLVKSEPSYFAPAVRAQAIGLERGRALASDWKRPEARQEETEQGARTPFHLKSQCV